MYNFINSINHCHSTNKTLFVPGIALSPGDTALNQTDKEPSPRGTFILVQGDIKNQ